MACKVEKWDDQMMVVLPLFSSSRQSVNTLPLTWSREIEGASLKSFFLITSN